MKLNKKYSYSDLNDLVLKGATITRNFKNDTHALAGQGLIIRYGININNVEYQAIYTSKGYATTITQDIKILNENKLHNKHYHYLEKAKEHFLKNIESLIK